MILNCLNPCFNGRYSLRPKKEKKSKEIVRLNPCFNGRYSLSLTISQFQVSSAVLILVLMEDTH